MKLSEKANIETFGSTKPANRFAFITYGLVKLVVPIGPRFQAHIPSWTPSSTIPTITDTKSDGLRWLGIQVWPTEGKIQDSKDNDDTVGRGRSGICQCSLPSSIECVRRHVSDERTRLRAELGLAFSKWKFDNMGEDVSRSWSREDESLFSSLMRMELSSRDRGFMKRALECFPSQNKGSILSYYLNVYIPRRMGVQTRSGCVEIDADDDDDEDNEKLPIKGSRKRLRANGLVLGGPTKYRKTKYLSTCR